MARAPAAEASTGLLRGGYRWAPSLRAGRTAVAARVLGRPAVVVGGPEGVRRFYDPRLRRRGAMPAPVARVLFGRGSVHGLDDDEHHRHKALYLEVLTADAMTELRERAHGRWEFAVRTWEPGRPLVLFDQAVRVLTATALDWAGVEADPRETDRRAGQLSACSTGSPAPVPPSPRPPWRAGGSTDGRPGWSARCEPASCTRAAARPWTPPPGPTGSTTGPPPSCCSISSGR